MELYQLGYFLQIASRRSFTRAAEHLHMAQPALSQQMKNLETELGTSLFIRGRRETQLTAAGKTLLPRAEALLALAKAAKMAVADAAQLRGGRLVIAAIPSVSACLLPKVIANFGKLHGEVELRLIEESSEAVAQSVESGLADIGFLQPPVSKRTFQTQMIVTEPFVLLAAKSHPAARFKEVRLKKLADEAFVFYKGRARDSALEACRKAGFEPRIACESGELETIRALVAAGLGVAVVPQIASHGLPPLVKAITIREPKMERQIAAAWKKAGALSPAAQAFLKLIP